MYDWAVKYNCTALERHKQRVSPLLQWFRRTICQISEPNWYGLLKFIHMLNMTSISLTDIPYHNSGKPGNIRNGRERVKQTVYW